MGEVIRKSAAAADIFADVRTTLQATAARGGELQTQAQDMLGPIDALAKSLTDRLRAAEAAVEAPRQNVLALDEQADALLVSFYEECWNLAGRSAYDPLLAILFPGGAAAWTDGPTAEQPSRMTLLADLLEAHLHPAIPAIRADEMAAEVRAAAATLRAAVTEAADRQTAATVLLRTRTALASAAAVQLARLKRLWLATVSYTHLTLPTNREV